MRKTGFLCSILFSALACALPAQDFGPVDMDAFYTSLPALNPDLPLGSLVKAEKIASGLPEANAWKIAYVSSDIHGNKTLVTGLVAAPQDGDKTVKRPVVAWAHGTTGTAQNCGPSQVPNPAQPLNQYLLPNGNSWTDLGMPAMKAFIKAGYVLVATDYQGLGGGGQHQYAVAGTQARDVIDSIRAVAAIPEAQAGNRALIYGWSQGGGATIAAASLSDYINQKGTARDGIELVGFVAMAPYDITATLPVGANDEASATRYLQSLGETFSPSVFDFSHYVQSLWGMVAAFPELKLTDILTDRAAQLAEEILSRKCMHVVSETLSYNYSDDYRKALRPDLHNVQSWTAAYRAGSIMPVKPVAPVIIYYGTKDVTVPPMMSAVYFDRTCKLGGNLTRIQLPGDVDHFMTPQVAEPLYIPWVADRFAGIAAKNGCKEQGTP